MIALKKMAAVLTLLYPILLYTLRDSSSFKKVALSLGGLLMLELSLRLSAKKRLVFLLLICSVALLMLTLGLNNMERLYPFLMSASMLALFASSSDPNDNPMIGPIRTKVLADPKLLPILHQAKWIWIVGLTVNSMILAVFLFAFPLDRWLLYASFYSYLLLAALFLLSIGYVGLRRWRSDR